MNSVVSDGFRWFSLAQAASLETQTAPEGCVAHPETFRGLRFLNILGPPASLRRSGANMSWPQPETARVTVLHCEYSMRGGQQQPQLHG